MAAYLGPEILLSHVLYDAPHSLQHQAHAPRELIWGTVNVDGTGVAWWDGEDAAPLRYVTAEPPWKDANLPHLAPRLRSGAILAAVRSATPGIPFGAGNVAPFVSGRLAAVHNGFISGFRGPVGRAMIAGLPDDLYENLDTVNDSKALFLTVVKHYAGDLVGAVRRAVLEVAELAHGEGRGAALNLMVGDGTRVVATRYSVGLEVNSLYTASRGDAQLLASEPFDDEADWKPVEPAHLIDMTRHGLTVVPLEAP
ncbi:MAG: ergothioneine biosynthesis protein EgtC [Acidimicrobiia bacterium]